MNLLFIGDVVGRPGRRAIEELLPDLRDEFSVDVVVANGENLAGGSGLTAETGEAAFATGIDLLTGGNHLFDRNEGMDYIRSEPRVIRPANYPDGVPGETLGLLPVPGGTLAVGCILGRVFMRPMDDPFRAADRLVERAGKAGARYVVIDAHAEASSEKMALGWYLAGRVSLVVGTHTHVPTPDERVLSGGTAFITDAGMTGPYESIIGMEKDAVLAHFLTGLRHRFKPAWGDVRLCGVVVEMDETTGRARSIRRVMRQLKERSR
jgi:metallophosphoesterase (TIGR00282 family)